SRPPIRSARRSVARHESRHRSGRNRSSTAPTRSWSASGRSSCSCRRPTRADPLHHASDHAVLLLPLLVFIALLTRDRSLMGEYATGRAWTVVIVAVTLMIATATVLLGVVLVGG